MSDVSALVDACARAIDEANASDPITLFFDGRSHPQAQLEGRRAQAWVEKLRPEAPAALRLAARAHHLRRWEVPRDSYPRTRAGYRRWREGLYVFHGERLAELMETCGFSSDEILRAKTIMKRGGIKSDPDIQSYEDGVSLAFLEVRLSDFAPTVSDSQLERALRRTWAKMSAEGQEAAGSIPLDPEQVAALESILGFEN
ncbi:MAG TPA: DUF4202 family protein [Dehalococcoidia bacterium]|nr:DUF4202 family protein [Dehalococcoidia bacterium]